MSIRMAPRAAAWAEWAAWICSWGRSYRPTVVAIEKERTSCPLFFWGDIWAMSFAQGRRPRGSMGRSPGWTSRIRSACCWGPRRPWTNKNNGVCRGDKPPDSAGRRSPACRCATAIAVLAGAASGRRGQGCRAFRRARRAPALHAARSRCRRFPGYRRCRESGACKRTRCRASQRPAVPRPGTTTRSSCTRRLDRALRRSKCRSRSCSLRRPHRRSHSAIAAPSAFATLRISCGAGLPRAARSRVSTFTSSRTRAPNLISPMLLSNSPVGARSKLWN